MPTLAEFRAAVVQLARADNGDDVGVRGANGDFYPGPVNKYNLWARTGAVFACAQAVSYWFATAGGPIPQANDTGDRGIWFVPYLLQRGIALGAIKPSWESEPGDVPVFGWPYVTKAGVYVQPTIDTPGAGDHTGVVVEWRAGVLFTMEADSGPGLAPFDKPGGTKLHAWSVPAGVGNPMILGVIDAGKLARLVSSSTPTTDPEAPEMNTQETQQLADARADAAAAKAAATSALDRLTTLQGSVDVIRREVVSTAGGLLRVNGPYRAPGTDGPNDPGVAGDSVTGRAFGIYDVDMVAREVHHVHAGYENAGTPDPGDDVPVRPVTRGWLRRLTYVPDGEPGETDHDGYPVAAADGGRPVSSAGGGTPDGGHQVGQASGTVPSGRTITGGPAA